MRQVLVADKAYDERELIEVRAEKMIEIISHPGPDRSVTLEELYDYQDAEGSVTQNGNENGNGFCPTLFQLPALSNQAFRFPEASALTGRNSSFNTIPIPLASRFIISRLGLLVPFSILLISA